MIGSAPPRPLVIAHRGASGTLPGNSLEAFERAIAVGADMVEFDVRRTADDQLIVFHDAEVARRPVGRLSRQEILSATGLLPPLLDEVLELTRGRVGIDVELKEGSVTNRVVRSVAAWADPETCVLSSFLDEVVSELADLAPAFGRGLIVGRQPIAMGRRSAVARAQGLRATHLVLQRGLARERVLKRAARRGLGVFVWTVDDRRSLARYLGNPLVRGVVTNLPERALALRGEFG
ncbi:MAG TPA: glycerophosphodiester phosphodiesterase [Candidatus Nanopelagicaceae bacterium]|nr:glycerophosphodiester phosphodiesterase [Candidatus Nanopelagicaceae bacterium]